MLKRAFFAEILGLIFFAHVVGGLIVDLILTFGIHMQKRILLDLEIVQKSS